MRALILEAIDDETKRKTSAGELVVDMSKILDPIATLDNLLEVSSSIPDLRYPVR